MSCLQTIRAWDRKKKILFGGGALALILVAGGIGYSWWHQTHSATVEWNTTTVDYGAENVKLVKATPGKVVYQSSLDTLRVGKQKVMIQVEEEDGIKSYSKTFTVQDTKKPKISVNQTSITVGLREIPDIESLHIEATDPVDGDCSYSVSKVDTSSVGTKKLVIKATDRNNNTSKKEIKVKVSGLHSQDLLKQYREACAKATEAYEKRIQEIEAQEKKEQEEKERQELIASLGVEHLSEDVLQWALEVHKINQEIWDTQYDAIVLAVIQTESGGKACDLMQSSESHNASAPGNSCGIYQDELDALRGGIQALKNAFTTAGVQSRSDYDRIAYALQGYCFGPRWFEEYDRYTYQNSLDFSEKMKKELGWDVYGVPGYPTYVFKYYEPSYQFEESEESQPDTQPSPPSTPSNPSPESSDKTELYRLLATVQDLKESDYTSDSWNRLQQAVRDVDFTSPSSSLQKLQRAYQALVRV